jgi:L-ribulose-5-phosphate 3-epimerase
MKRKVSSFARNDRIDRRKFVAQTGFGALAAVTVPSLAAAVGAAVGGTPDVAFNTANLVARVTGYRFELRNWMDQHARTVAATDAGEWRAICREIAATGFKTVEIWEAHASPETMDRAKAAEWKRILADSGLRPVAYAGRLSPETVRICQWLEIPHVDGGLGSLDPDRATALCRETGIRFNYENHPEKSAAEILGKIGGGNDWLGVCIDTGWLGTQGVSGPEVIRACGSLVRHNHIKDVTRAGAHETCLLGEGVAEVEECLKAFREIGYTGAYSWEDEPEDRNPMESAVRNREWIETRLSS